VAVVGVIVVVAAGAVWATGVLDDDDRPPTYVGQIGEFQDPNDFVSFAEEMSEAIERGDAEWFVDHSRRLCVDVTFPCRCFTDDAGVWVEPRRPGETERIRLTGKDYEAVVGKILGESTAESADAYGPSETTLYAIGARPLPESDVGEFQMTAIASSVFSGSEPVPPLRDLSGRTALLIDAEYIVRENEWVITGLSAVDRYTNDEITLRRALDPEPPSTDWPRTWVYWQRWPLAND